MTGETLSFAQGAVLALSSALAGAVNSIAGGGTLLTFPTLIWLGLPPIAANATSTVGLVPGSIAGAWGYRAELGEVRQWLLWLIPASLLGGAAGALLLLVTPPALFAQLAPVLVLGATLLFAVSGPLGRRLALGHDGAPPSPGRVAMVVLAQLLISVYGGYFGAGMGILMLAAYALLDLGSIHRANGLKTFAGFCINGIAAALFVARGVVHWPAALTMILGSILGGYLAARVARRLGQGPVRALVIAIGLVAAASLAIPR